MKDNLQEVRARVEAACRRAGRSPDEVRLVAVSKRQPDDRLVAAYEAGHRDFGENYVQELERKRALFSDARWHLIGHLQSNKAKRAIVADLIHTLDSEKIGRALSKAAAAAGVEVRGLIEVNLGGEASKSGVEPDAVAPLLDALAAVERVRVEGLMCIPPPGEGPRYFARMAEMTQKLRASSGLPLPELSMGMSADYEEAIEHGATLVRVGTAIFGEREG